MYFSIKKLVNFTGCTSMALTNIISAHKVTVIFVFAASVTQIQNCYMCINFVPQLNVFNNIFPTASFCLPGADVLFMHLKG